MLTVIGNAAIEKVLTRIPVDESIVNFDLVWLKIDKHLVVFGNPFYSVYVQTETYKCISLDNL